MAIKRQCDACKHKGMPLVPRDAVYDAKTIFGAWAYLCEEHYQDWGDKSFKATVLAEVK